MTLTIEDIRNPKNRSGFNHVQTTGVPGPNGGGGQSKWRAVAHLVNPRWHGSRRATPEEAAQDYCDYMNGRNVKPTASLKSAGHKGPSRSTERTAEEKKLRKRLREIEADRNQDRNGYVYLIGEEGSLHAVKVGFSYDPETRPNGLQTGNPRRLIVLASMEGSLDDESALHQKFIKDNILQEWFYPTSALLSEFGVDWKEYVRACSPGIVREEAA